MITGPQSPSVLKNMPVSTEQHVKWIADFLKYTRDRDLGYIRPTLGSEDAWL